jgi:hypothetical protein
MNSNVFSIDSNVVVSEKTSRLNNWCSLTVLQWKRFLCRDFETGRIIALFHIAFNQRLILVYMYACSTT